MSTPNCSDFVTRAEYEQLLIQLKDLQFEISSVQLDLSGHKSLDVPQAHNYRPQFEVITELNNNLLTTAVVIEGESKSDVVEFPDSVIPSVTMDIFEPVPGEYVFKVGVNGEFDEDILILEQGRLDVAIDTFEIDDRSVALVVQVGEERAETTLYFPEAEDSQHIASNLSLSASYFNDTLTITVADGESQDTAQVFIDANVINDFGGGGSSVSCENFSQELTNCCADLSQEFQDCCGQLLSAIATNLQKIQELEQYVTVDISSTVCSDYSCEFPKDESNQPLLTYAEAKLVEKDFEGKGIAGLNQRLKYLAINQDAIYKEICKAIDPIRTITKNDFYQFCNDGNIKRSDYADTEEGTELYEAAVEIYLAQLATESKYGHLLAEAGEGDNPVILSAPASYINNILIDFALIQSRNNSSALCAIAEQEPVDVVSVVASPEVITNVSGKVLILHFVTLDNYPKRKANSYPRPVQIPAALTEYSWDEHFRDLRWVQGNQYGALELEGYKKKVSGWFRDEDAGNAYFDAVLGLTTAVEKNRVFPIHSNPRTDIKTQVQRPHRAFIESVNDQGRAICHVKYRPVI